MEGYNGIGESGDDDDDGGNDEINEDESVNMMEDNPYN